MATAMAQHVLDKTGHKITLVEKSLLPRKTEIHQLRTNAKIVTKNLIVT